MPQATAAAIITSRQAGRMHILLTRRARHLSFPGEWCLPGAHIEPYEKARNAVIREVKEETGLDFEAQFLRLF